jgi:acetyl-CoA carboxylase biotin carboxyl carrier protein
MRRFRMDFELDLIKSLIDLMNENHLQEIEIDDGEKKIRLKKSNGNILQELNASGVVAPANPILTRGSTQAMAPPSPEKESENNVSRILSPMVGTFYRSPSPEAEPYVEVGDEVHKDMVICVIEAMKVMNEIKAECEGVIKEILVANGEAVEYGEPLFLIVTNGTTGK